MKSRRVEGGSIDHQIADLASALRGDAERLARHLLPLGRRIGREWVCRGRNSPTGEAISVNIGSGPKRGICGFWNGAKRGGDVLELIAEVRGCGKREAIEWARAWLGSNEPSNDRRMENVDRRPRLDEEQERQTRLTKAIKIWDEAGLLSGIHSTYLASRGLDLVDTGGELRAHHSLWHPNGGTFPTIIARVSRNESQVGIWRIYLKPDGSGKAPVDNPKLGLGDVRGGAVRIGGIWPEIGIAEGIETALACRQIIRDATGHSIPVWAALSTSGIRSFELPDGIASVRIFADADPIKFCKGQIKESPGLAAAIALEGRISIKGKVNVTIEAPPVGMDWLDVLNATREKV